MLVDAALLPFGTALRADVVVVGAGPVGLTVARQLAASGLHVVLAEAGRHDGRADADALRGVSVGESFPMVASRPAGSEARRTGGRRHRPAHPSLRRLRLRRLPRPARVVLAVRARGAGPLVPASPPGSRPTTVPSGGSRGAASPR